MSLALIKPVPTVMAIESFKIKMGIPAQALKVQHTTDEGDCKQKILKADIICAHVKMIKNKKFSLGPVSWMFVIIVYPDW